VSPGNTDSAAIVRLKDINVAGHDELKVHIYLATARTDPRPESNDFIRIQYAMDGDTGGTVLTSGSYTTIGQFCGDVTGEAVGGLMRKDADLDGFSDDDIGAGSPTLTATFTEYSFSIPATGTNLSVQVRLDQDGGSEEYGFDHIRVTGDLATSAAPILAGIEGPALSYTEGDPATQVTNTLTVSDADSTIASGTVTITSGFVAGQDVLQFTPSGGISGSFVAGTLSLSGVATPAQYQTVLRSVKYLNTNTTNPDTSPRTITFKVNDGSGDSNVQSRLINSTPLLAVGTIPHTESFETNGESLTYLSNSFDAGPDHFVRHEFGATNPHPEHSVSVSGVDGSWAWAAEDVVSNSNPLGTTAPGVILVQDLNSTGYTGLEVTISLAHAHSAGSSGFELADNLQVQFAFGAAGTDGTDLLGGAYNTVGRFDGAGGSPGALLVTGATNVGDGTAVTSSMQDFTFSIPNTGGNLSVRILDNLDGGNEEHVIDNIRITGTFGPANDPPQLANIEGTSASFSEGGPAVQVTSTLTVTDSDDTDLEGATAAIIGGFDASEDQLLFSNQNGISGSFVGNTLTLSGTSSVANYQAALRSIQYNNTDAVDASPATRTIRFIANDGDTNGNFQDRSIGVTPVLNAPVSITFAGLCESFETSGEGNRYGSSHGISGANYFERVPAAAPPADFFGGAISGPGLDGSFAWAAEDSVSLVGGEAVLLLAPYTITGFTGLEVSIALENPRNGDVDQWE